MYSIVIFSHGMASCSGVLSEEQFLCSICLEVFSSPVSTPCGHSFCKACINGYWDHREVCQCPLCKETFLSRPQLSVNRALAEITENFLRMETSSEHSSAKYEESLDTPEEVGRGTPGVVACDVCTGAQQMAVRSCLVCLTSYCQEHGKSHSTRFTKHKLIQPVSNLQDRMCKKHDRPLELFCRSDQTCVCVLCNDMDHQSHDTVPAERAWAQQKTQLKKTEADVQQMIQERQRKVEEIRQCVELSRVFSALMRSIERRQAELTKVMEEKQRVVETRAEGLIKDLEQELTQLQKRTNELEKLSQTEDHLHFLQSFPSLCTPPHTKDWSDVGVHADVCVGTVRRAVTQLEDSVMEQLDVRAGGPSEMRDGVLSLQGAVLAGEELYQQVHSILETVSPNTFQQAMRRMITLRINTEDRLMGVVMLILEKAVSNPTSSVVYANMSRCLMGLKVPCKDKPGETTHFRKVLLNLCQKEFERGFQDEDEDEAPSKVGEAAGVHQRWLGTVAFMCELYKLKMLTEAIMYDCINKMLKNEDSLEGVCCLLSSIGKELDHEKAKPRMDQYYRQLEKIIHQGKASSQICRMVEKVLDLRRNRHQV
ncbi:hypothetical protein JZ751_015409 [Albula glossodonta]|uniref:Uncharacterized protein n=1 Tax=Albula glossodonta TaxID=121402 RepID=A0A8T2N731_9TELE|nr:hypothetical protein JZ751_015409 [Albula glossodonta]